jgi:protein arginine N-methyltransferase 5
MHSWFPLYFPIKHPVTAYKGQEIRISIWRCTQVSKVWYEWSFEVFDPSLNREVFSSFIHNVDGKGYAIGL